MLPCNSALCNYTNNTNTSENVLQQKGFTEPPPNLALRDLFISMAIVNAFIAVVAFCLNALVIATFALTKSLWTPRNILLLGLAISDAAVAIIAEPFFSVHLYSYWYGSPELTMLSDEVNFFSFTMLSMVSFGNLTLITADRYLAVRLHLRYNEIVTTKRCCISLLIVWVSSGVATYLRNLQENMYYIPLIDLFIYLVIMISNVFLMVKIMIVVRRHTIQIHAQRSSLDMPKYKRSVNTMYYVLAAFVLCNIGHIAGLVMIVVLQDWNELVSFVLTPADTIMMLNGALNPFIYCLRIKEIRTDTIALVRKLVRH